MTEHHQHARHARRRTPPGRATGLDTGRQGSSAFAGQRAAAFAVLAVLSIATIGFAAVAVYSYDIAATLRDHGRLATATVLKYEHPHKERGYAVVRFTTGGERPVIATVHDLRRGTRPKAGGTLVVRYAPEDPLHYAQDARQRPHFEDVWRWGTFALITGAIGAVAVVKVRRRRNRAG